MKLRTKLLLGYTGFVLALGVLGAWSARTLSQMSAVSSRIIAENYDSVVAAQDMKESLERQDSAALFDLLGQRGRARRQVTEHRARFDAALAKASANITETGEPEAIGSIRRGRDEYYRRFDAFLNASGDRTALYFQSLEPQFDQLRSGADRLLRLNQEAMRRKADAASRIARRWFFVTLALAIILMAAGVAIELSLSRAIVGPVAQLTAATTRLASGELDTTVTVRSGDEIGTLAAGFNRMAERIRELRRSDMGQLLVAQQTTEAAIDSLYDPVIVTDSGGRVTRINPAAERLFGARPETLGKPVEVVVRDPGIAQSVCDVLASQVPVVTEDATAMLPWAVDGTRRAFRIRSTPMKDADGRLVGVVTLLEDITHLSEVSRLKSEFIAAASHELRTPLTSVQMGIHLLLEGTAGSLDERQQDILQVCREDTARLDRLMRELLDLSKIESGAVTPQLVPTRPATLLGAAVDPLRLQVEARGVRLDVDAPPDLPYVDADRSQVERVIANLITNAMRATPAGGTITVAAVRRDHEVAISVADTGAGIPRDYLPRIFEPFVQVPHASGGGAGLGLTISRRIVEGHGGRLTVQSEPGHGSTFTFTLRVAGEGQSLEIADHR
jgi:two-component system, NtrC family, sensor histidine kinase KinB